MTSREDFKQAIRTGNINEAFLVAMSNAPELNITTKIISSKKEHNQDNQAQYPQDNYLRTHINLIEGKIENEIGEKLTGDRYSEIKQFHIQQVTQGHQTIQHNLISLQKMFQLMSAFQQQQQNSDPLNWVDIAADVTRESLPTKPDSKLYGNRTPDALEAGITENKTNITSSEFDSEEEADKPEPQLPSFDSEEEAEDGVVDDLLSLADIDEDVDEPKSEEEEQPPEKQADWGEWLEDEPEAKPEVFDLKSLNIRDAAHTWQSWDSHHSPNSQPTREK